MLWWTLRQLLSSQWQTRVTAAVTLGESKATKAVPALVKALGDGERPVRLAVMTALGKIGDPSAVAPLVFALSGLSKAPRTKRSGTDAGSSGEEYEMLARALAGLKESAVLPLLGLLDSSDKEIRRWIAFALGLIGDRRAVTPLVGKLEDNRAEVRKAVIAALESIGDAQSIAPLAKALASRDPETRRAVVRALGQIGGAAAIPALSAALTDRDEAVQCRAVEALKSIGSVQAAVSLRPAIESDRKAIREAATAALKSMPVICADAHERAALAVLTGHFDQALLEGDAAVEPLIDALQSRNADARIRAAEALGQLRAPRAVDSLLGRLRDPELSVCEAAAQALARIGKPAAARLQERLESLDAAEERLAAQALEIIGDAASASALAEMIVRNKRTSSSYPIAAQAAKTAAGALESMLEASGTSIPESVLLRIADLPDVVLVHEAGDVQVFHAETFADCSHLREMARHELSRRGLNDDPMPK